ncbi:MAG: NAD(+) synthase [Lachnospiraceae bacterium]
MRDGYVKVSAATPKIAVGDIAYNTNQILQCIEESKKSQVKLCVLPELCITGYTCGDLFLQELLLRKAKEALCTIAEATSGSDMVTVVGLPLMHEYRLYNCAAFVQNGMILGIVPKTYIPNYSEFYEGRYFASGRNIQGDAIRIGEYEVPFGTNLLFACEELPELVLGCELCEDLWSAIPPSSHHALAGATVICNPSASDETTAKDTYRKQLVANQSARCLCAYIYADCGEGESTQDLVYSAHNLIAENGTVLAESERFQNQMIVTEIDVYRLVSERRRISTFQQSESSAYFKIGFHLNLEEVALSRTYSPYPFIPAVEEEKQKRCDEILMLQAMGLKKRLEHAHCRNAVIGISGGLDSTLAMIVTARAFDLLDIPRENILCVTMPCFGTTDRTYHNAVQLTARIGGTLKEISIEKAVKQHFLDINHEETNHDITYENSQARERTQILMDLANKNNGMVIGTGDLSELALGWATYNGDHMSMYAVNSSVPKTLVRHLVHYYADTCGNGDLKKVLYDVLDTPVSPELLPPVDGQIAQKTEDLVGPYELHDFFLYYMMRFGFSPKKIYRIATQTFDRMYSHGVIYKWLRTFMWRFFSQQFKRSCIPDGPKVGSVALSPRGDWRMPSDASVALWMAELDDLQNFTKNN